MESAKSSVKNFLSKGGHHDTTVHENVAPAVQHEQVAQTGHEHTTTALDKEVHQDHYHTTEQPIQHSETLPEQHHHNLIPTEHRSFEHDDADKVKSRLTEERSKYQDHHTRVDGEQTKSVQPTVAGEHVHHHVHENIQPVIQKQTVEPHVVHTTVPIHEVHHNEAQHHATTALPAMSMEDFKNKGGSLKGREEGLTDQFHGCPPEEIAGHKPHSHDAGTAATASNRDAGIAAAPDSRDTRDTNGSMTSNLDSHRGDGTFRDSTKHAQVEPTSTSNSTDSATGKKPSIIDRLNPKKDADGDGKAGIMK